MFCKSNIEAGEGVVDLLLLLSSKMTKSQIHYVQLDGRWRRGLLTYFPTFVPELKNDKILNFLCLVWGGGKGC